MQLAVGRIAKAHGIGGEVSVEVRTDDAEHRFARGACLATQPGDRGPLVVEASRWHSGRLLVRFAGVSDRTTAETLRNTLLVVDSSTSTATADADEFWTHDLIGLDVLTVAGAAVGTVDDVVQTAGSALLVIACAEGGEALVPFVSAMVPTVDMTARRILVDLPDGLLDL
jgi:16S rRNA processing protein RimM